MLKLIEDLAQGAVPGRKELTALLARQREPEIRAALAARARAVREERFGRDVYLRGLIEFTNYCRNDCLYCGLRRSNARVERYRLTSGEILERAGLGYELGFRTFVLQGGEDPAETDERLTETVGSLRRDFPDCAITLSVGEKSRASYEKYRRAGADRFLLRHETANPAHYARLHPPGLSLAGRRRCLEDLKDLGYQVGAGFMVGSPWQTPDDLAGDLLFLKELAPQMVGLGPFLPHPETPLGRFPPGDPDLTVFLLGLTRLMLPDSLLPATTALGTREEGGREKALDFGANVLMPNLSPLEARRKYEIYAGKIHQGEEAAEEVGRLRKHLAELGYATPESRGDAGNFLK